MASKPVLKAAANVKTVEGQRGYSQYSAEETESFSDYVNRELAGDQDLAHHLPLDKPEKLFEAIKDGILMCKMINKVKPSTIDERVMNLVKGGKGLNPWKINENHQLAINSAKGIGIHVVNVNPDLLCEGRPNIVLGVVWQIIRLGLTQNITLLNHPELVRLLKEGEELGDFQKLPPEDILIRWVNYHLANAGTERRVTGFSNDIKDSEVYTLLLNQISPNNCCSKAPMQETDLTVRAQKVLEEAAKIDCKKFVTAKDIVQGNPKLNFAFVANLFNTHPALAPIDKEKYDFAELMAFDAEGTREERALRYWIQSLGLECNNLFEDMESGILLAQLFEKVDPTCIDLKKLDKKPKMKIHKVQNANLSIDAAKKLNFSIVNIGGQDIISKNKKMILAIVWQLMRYSLIKVLKELGGGSKISDDDIVKWANSKVNPEQIKNFKDKTLKTGVFLCKICHALAPTSVNMELVAEGNDDSGAELNAKYAISCARKIGATVFSTPEDLKEVVPNMILSFVASLMIVEKGKSAPKPAAEETPAPKPAAEETPAPAENQ